MIRLPEHKRKNGFDYKLVLRGKRSCIYEQRVSETVTRYEVFLIKVQPESEYQGKIFPEQERFPNDEALGYWAWTCLDYASALKRFNDLEEQGGGSND